MTNYNTAWEKRGLPFGLAFAVFLLVTLPLGVMRPLWYDEMASRWAAEASSVIEFSERIKNSMDPSPPLFQFAQYVFVHLFGMAEWTGRLPSMIGYGVSLTFLYRFVAHRLDTLGGATAMAIMTLSGSIYYAQEGRPYGLSFGAAAVAMWSWQQYVERDKPGYAMLCGAALFTVASLHYYSVLLSIPFALAELARWWERRRIDWKMVLVLAMPSTALLVHLPLIRSMLSTYSIPEYNWSKPTWAFPSRFWERALEPGILIFVGIVIFISFLWRFQKDAEAAPKLPRLSLPDAELVLLVGFALLPVFGTIFAKFVTNAITPRYVFSAMVGFSALLAHLIVRTVPKNGLAGVFLLLLAGAAGNGLLDIRWMMRDPPPGQLEVPVVTGEAALPVVIDDYLLYAQLSRYAKPELLARLVYLTDLERLRRYTQAGQMELITVAGVRLGQFRGQAGYLGPYLESHARFLLFEPLRPATNEGWLAHDLIDRGIGIRLLAVQGGGRWYLVGQK